MTFSSSNKKCLDPITARFPSYSVTIPCATMYFTSLWSSSCLRPSSSACFTIAVAILCAKCSSIQAAILKISSRLYRLDIGTTSTTFGVAFVNVPVLSNIIVSAFA